MGIRLKRRLIAAVYHCSVIAVIYTGAKAGSAFGSEFVFQSAIALFIIHILTFKVVPVSRRLQELLIPEASCFACGATVDLVNRYKCGCGFLSFKDRHAFSPCPNCGKGFLWVVCPACETSIPI
ncbi:MAG: hypothetical protein QY316_12890 [Thermodesulfobacteriota bacterium]|nr:MAG: hypothetical protein QY316_12890 [Thermodesulfobacteriota bacterium]